MALAGVVTTHRAIRERHLCAAVPHDMVELGKVLLHSVRVLWRSNSRHLSSQR